MNIITNILKTIAAMIRRYKDKKKLLNSIIVAAEHGVIAEDEMSNIRTRMNELGLTEDDLKHVRVRAYNAALDAVKSNGQVTSKKEADLGKIQLFLKIPDEEIANSKKELARLRLVTEIQNGNLPDLSVQDVILQKNEIAHWSEPASLLEERVVDRRYEGGSHGVSIRIVKGIYYRVGSQRGHLVTDKAVVPISWGDLIITNKRIIFRGDSKSFNVRLDKLLETHLFSDGLRITDDKGKTRIIRFVDSANRDIVGATLSYVVNGYAASE